MCVGWVRPHSLLILKGFSVPAGDKTLVTQPLTVNLDCKQPADSLFAEMDCGKCVSNHRVSVKATANGDVSVSDSPALLQRFQRIHPTKAPMTATVVNDSDAIMGTPTVKNQDYPPLMPENMILVGAAGNSGSLNALGTPLTHAPPTRSAPYRRGQDRGARMRGEMALLLVLVPGWGAEVGWTFLHSVFAVGVQFLTVSSSWSHLRQRRSKQRF